MSVKSPKSPLKSPDKLSGRYIPDKFKQLIKARQSPQKSLSTSLLKQIQLLFDKLEDFEDSVQIEELLSNQRLPSIQARNSEKEIEKFYLHPHENLGQKTEPFRSIINTIKVKLDSSDFMRTNPVYIFNAIFILRRQILAFNNLQHTTRLVDRFEDIIQAQEFILLLVKLVSQNDLSNNELLGLYFECLSTLLEILSVELIHVNSPVVMDVKDSKICDLFYEIDRETTNLFCRRLIYNFFFHSSYVSSGKGIAFYAGINYVQYLGVISGAFSYIFSSSGPDSISLAFLSIQLYLLLSSNQKNNFYIDVLGALFEKDQSLCDFFEPAKLYQALVKTIDDETSSLMLYLLMLHNDSFREYILSLADPSELVIPLLRFMFEFSLNPKNQYQLQIVGAIFLMCMEGEEVIKNLQQKVVQPLSWFQGRLFQQLPLSEFVIHVLLKMISSNLSEPRDQYMYSICIASLSNMAQHVSGLQASLVQKIFSLIEFVNKKLIKLGQSNSTERQLKLHGISIYEELLFLLVEFSLINLKMKPSDSTHIVYALLQHKDFLSQFLSHPSLGNLMSTAFEVVVYFEKCIADSELSSQPSIVELSDLISKEVLTWQPTFLEAVCSHKFTYAPCMDQSKFFKALIWVSIGTRISSLLHEDSLYLLLLKQWDC